MTCHEVDELAPAYALGALTPEERADFEAHLEVCMAHEAVLADNRSAVRGLQLSVAELEPPRSLKARIMEDVRDGQPEATRPAPASTTRSGWKWRRPRLSPWPALAVVVLLAAGLLAWNLALQLSTSDADAFVRYMENEAEDIHGNVYFVEGVGVITVEGLEPLAPDKTYQAWAVIESEIVSLGLLQTSEDGDAFVVLDHHVTDDEPVFITVEPSQGNDWPSGSTVLTTER